MIFQFSDISDFRYLSPSDKFQYENQFHSLTKNNHFLSLKDLDPIFNQSRITSNEFLQIWY